MVNLCKDCQKEIKRDSTRCNSCAQKYRFKDTPVWNKGIKRWWSSSAQWKKKDPRVTGENQHCWKGDDASYAAKHQWVYRNLESSPKCSQCDSTRFVQWANVSGEYKREKSDWIRLCAKCHHRYDNLSEKMWNTRRLIYG